MSDKSSNEPVMPPDGGWGWIVLLASFLLHLIIDGIGYSFGIYYFEFLEYYKSGKGETAWVGSMVPGVTLLFGSLAGILTDKYGCRITTVAGALIAAAGFILSMFSPNLYFLYFSFGILSGLGFSLIYLPAVTSVGHYFEKKRTVAVGIASSGSGIGAFIFNPLTKFLIDKYGWRGAILIQAGIILNCAICGALFRPLKPLMVTEENLKTLSTEDKHFDKLSEETLFSGRRINSCQESHQTSSQPLLHVDTFTETKQNHPIKKVADSFQSGGMKKNLTKKMCCCDLPTDVIISINQLCDFSRLKNAIFILFLSSNILASLGINTPFIFSYDFAVDEGIDEDSAKWLVSIIGITSTCGRAICGILADRPKVNKLYLFSVALTVCGTATALCSLCSTYILLVLFSCVFGLFHGIYIPLMSVVLVDLLGLQTLNNSFGLLIMFKGVANLIGPPVAGWLFDATGSYTVPYIVSGVIIAAGGILTLTPLIGKCRKQTNNQAGATEEE